ncbi:MAG: pyridoxamine kinase [Ruminococcus sp.]|nr:pyridoxamine kinase [Ruminococcus sp.]
MKKIVTIQDISCFGKCSLTVALPIISAMGIETAVIPTAVLSTHTGGFAGYTFRDLTDDIPNIANHWQNLGIKFNALYTGYLGSEKQVKIVSDFFDNFRTNENFTIVDPVLGDNGRFYDGFNENFAEKMAKLCGKADYIIPNMTEASFLLKIPYTESYDRAYIEEILRKLAGIGCKVPMLTGVRFDDSQQGAVAYNSEENKFYCSFGDNIARSVHGTGDIFASVFTGAVALGKSLQQALDIAVNFTVDCIKATQNYVDEMWYGSCFELCIPNLIKYINK